MTRRSLLALYALALAACGNHAVPHTGGDAPADAAGDALPPPDASPYALSIGAPDVVADGVTTRMVTITGLPNVAVVPGADRPALGFFTPQTITLDASGTGSTTYTPCSNVVPGCLGPANLTLATAAAPAAIVASTPIALDLPADVGDVTACQTTGNVLYVNANSGMFAGGYQTSPTASWVASAMPDHLQLTISGGLQPVFSLLGLLTPFAPGVYSDAQAPLIAQPGHPGIDVPGVFSAQCIVHGRFKVWDYTADPNHGTVYSTTISFEEACENATDAVIGCVHFETSPPPPPPTPPTPDPTQVSVQVLSMAYDGTPDTTAQAIFTDSGGTVVLDTIVDSWGMAQASLPSGGILTTIQYSNGREYLRSYRGMKNGDHIVINPANANTGTQDYMIGSFSLPPNSSAIGITTGCGGGGWNGGTGPVYAYLTFYDACLKPTFDALSIAQVADIVPHWFVWQKNVPHLANGNMVVANNWAPMGTAIVYATNVPSGVPYLHATWSTMIETFEMQTGSARVDSPAAGSTQSFLLEYPPGAGDGTVVDLSVGGFPAPTGELRRVVDPGAPATVTIDLSSQPVPIVSAVVQAHTGLSWTQTTGGSADVRVILWAATYTGGQAIWQVYEPNDGNPSSTLPSLPKVDAAKDPTADKNATLTGASVTYTDYDTVTQFTLAPPSGAYRLHSSHAGTAGF